MTAPKPVSNVPNADVPIALLLMWMTMAISLTLRGLADATTNAAAVIIAILHTNRIGRAEIISPCPNSGRFLKSVAKNRSRICARFPWISSERRLCLPKRTPLPLSFPKSFAKTPQRHYSRSITLARPRTGAPSFSNLTSKDAAAAGKSSPTTRRPATASRMTISRR